MVIWLRSMALCRTVMTIVTHTEMGRKALASYNNDGDIIPVTHTFQDVSDAQAKGTTRFVCNMTSTCVDYICARFDINISHLW